MNYLRNITALAALLLAPSVRAELISGDILVTDDRLQAIVRVDPRTGDRSIFSGPGVGSGPALGFVWGIAVDPFGGVLVTGGPDDAALIRVDPRTGDRTIVSGAGVGDGPVFTDVYGVAVSANGDIYVTDVRGLESRNPDSGVVRVDRATGDRTLVSGFGIGDGAPLAWNQFLDVDRQGNVITTDLLWGAARHVDTKTGQRVELVTGTPLPTGVAVEPDGNILITDLHFGKVVRYIIDGGFSIVLSGEGTGDGPEFGNPYEVAVARDGSIYVADAVAGAIYGIDPVNGDRRIISGAGVGQGIEFDEVVSLVVWEVAIPEPSTLTLAVIGLVAVVLGARRRRTFVNPNRNPSTRM